MHLLHNKINNFTIRDDVSIVEQMNDSHRFAQSYLEDKGYKLLKGVEKKD